jgi:hypothetical protein
MIIHPKCNYKLRASRHVYRKANVKTGVEGPPFIKVECDCGQRFEFYFDVATPPARQVVKCVNPACNASQDMVSLWRDRLPSYVDWNKPR